MKIRWTAEPMTRIALIAAILLGGFMGPVWATERQWHDPPTCEITKQPPSFWQTPVPAMDFEGHFTARGYGEFVLGWRAIEHWWHGARGPYEVCIEIWTGRVWLRTFCRTVQHEGDAP